MEEEQKDSVKERIIKNAIKIFGAEGFDGITIRKVAEQSNVNIASINYYFHSKENLIKETADYFFEKIILKIFLTLRNNNFPPEEKLYRFFYNYISGISQYPGFPKSLITGILNGNMFILEKLNFLKKEIALLMELISLNDSKKTSEEISITLMHMISAILFPAAMSNIYPIIINNINLSDKESRDLYIDTLIKNNLKINVEKYSYVKNEKSLINWEELGI